MITKETKLPTYEELTVQEVELSTPFLRAGALHVGKQCEAENNEFMLCRMEERDPRKCINEGKLVTACTLKFFQAVKRSCADVFHSYAICIDKSSQDFDLDPCRKTQAAFDACVKDNLGLDRPPFGYFCEARVHQTARPKPQPELPPVYPDALVEPPPDSIPRNPPTHQGRPIAW